MMDRLRGIWLRVRALFRRGEVDRELEDELAFHLAMETDAGVKRGLSEEEARREARVRFGGVDRWTEETRDARGLGLWDELRQDARLALRMLTRQRLFAVAAVLTLALGIGANTAIYSVIRAVLLGQLPFAAPDRLVMVWETDRSSGTTHEPASWPDVEDFRERSRTVSDFASMAGWESTLTGAGADPERVAAMAVTPNFLSMLGVRPVAGRLFAPDEGRMEAARVVLLSEAFWRARFGADPSVVGGTITLNEQPTTVVGIVPSDADVGIRQVIDKADYGPSFGGSDVDVWLAMIPDARQFSRQTHPFLTLGRLAPGATLTSARREMTSIATDLEREYADANEARGVNVEAYPDVVLGGVRSPLFLLLGAALLVLLVTCANVANLLLARTTARVREVAVRRALGAATSRLTRQFLVEAAVLTLLGSAAGVALAFGGLRVLIHAAPAGIPRLGEARVDGGVLVFTAGVAALVAVVFGLFPAWQARRVDLQSSLKAQGGRGASDGAAAGRLRSGLVVAEVALAVALAVGAGLLLRSFWQLRSVDPGFRTAHVLKAEYQLPEPRYRIDRSIWPKAPAIQAFHRTFLERVRALPGVESAALASPHPLDPGFTNSFVIVGREAESKDFPEIRCRFITPGYLRTLGVPLLSGRALEEGDDADAPFVAVINRAAAERYFSGRDPLGQTVRFWGTPWRIVGVIGDERFEGVDRPPDPAVYVPFAQAPQQSAAVVVRAAGDPMTLLPAIRRAFRAVDPQLALYGAERLDAVLSDSIAKPRFTAALLSLFAALALVLALVGVQGVLGYAVQRRAPEVGIRMALGATPGSVARLVLGEGVRLAAVGVAIGLLIALAASRLLAGLVFGVATTDPATFAAVTVAVLATAGLASWLPARRAVRGNPVEVLRAE